MMKFIVAATLVFLGGVASAQAQSSADSKEITSKVNAITEAKIATLTPKIEINVNDQAQQHLNIKLRAQMESKMRAQLNSHVLVVAN